MSVISSYKLKFTDGEYLNYIYSTHSFLENERLDNFFEKLENCLMDPYDNYQYELQIVRKVKKNGTD